MKGVWVTVIGVALFGVLGAPAAHAEKKKKSAAQAAPTSAQIAASMGELRWGMSQDELLKKFILKTRGKYEAVIAKTKNAVEEDRLRNEQAQEIEAINKGTVKFDGRTTGWDVSYLKGEFAHNTQESMLVVRDKNSQNFYFFIDGKLWKWYKAFDAEVFPADDFKAFEASVERRFGPGKAVQAELRPGAGKRQWLEWQDGQSRLRAIDETDFYGFYCLVFEHKPTSEKIAQLRGGATDNAGGPRRHALVESVTTPRDEHIDSAPDIADRISGRVRERAPSEPQPTPTPSARANQRSSAPAAANRGDRSSDATPAGDDDPLSGLGL
jgi:hypothetical protein